MSLQFRKSMYFNPAASSSSSRHGSWRVIKCGQLGARRSQGAVGSKWKPTASIRISLHACAPVSAKWSRSYCRKRNQKCVLRWRRAPFVARAERLNCTSCGNCWCTISLVSGSGCDLRPGNEKRIWDSLCFHSLRYQATNFTVINREKDSVTMIIIIFPISFRLEDLFKEN